MYRIQVYINIYIYLLKLGSFTFCGRFFLEKKLYSLKRER